MTSGKKILFVRSGGGIPGLDIHAGINLALADAGIFATHNSGTSAGAIVSAFDSAGYDARKMCGIVRGLSDADVRRARFAWKLRIPWIDYFLESAPIMHLLEQFLPTFGRDLIKPLACWAMRMSDGERVDVCRPGIAPNLPTAVMASMAISGIFPHVRINGDEYVDGGTRAYLPLPTDWQDYDEVYLCIASGSPGDYRKQNGMLTKILANFGWILRGQVDDILDAVFFSPKVTVLWPMVASDKGMLHFDHPLMDVAYQWTREKLNQRGQS